MKGTGEDHTTKAALMFIGRQQSSLPLFFLGRIKVKEAREEAMTMKQNKVSMELF